MQGIQGIQGLTGATGTSIVSIQGVLAGAGPPAGSGSTVGHCWVEAATESPRDAWVWDAAGAWVNVGPLIGPTGPTGAQGVQGVQGIQGTTGAAGSNTVTGLTDTAIAGAANEHFLIYNGSSWVNKSLADTKTILGI